MEEVYQSPSRPSSPTLSSSSHSNTTQDKLQSEATDPDVLRASNDAIGPQFRSRNQSVLAGSVIDVKPRGVIIHRLDASKHTKKEVSMRRSASAQSHQHGHREGGAQHGGCNAAKASQTHQASGRVSSQSFISNQIGDISRQTSFSGYGEWISRPAYPRSQMCSSEGTSSISYMRRRQG